MALRFSCLCFQLSFLWGRVGIFSREGTSVSLPAHPLLLFLRTWGAAVSCDFVSCSNKAPGS